MKRIAVILSLLSPLAYLLFFALFPEQDILLDVPLLHFYLVTFFTFTSAVVTFFTAISLGSRSAPRHRLLATAAAAMGAIFLIHGVTTPGALLFTVHPALTWAAWLTLFVGGVLFSIASLDTPEKPLSRDAMRLINGATFAFCLGFILVAAFAPELLAQLENMSAPWHRRLIYGLTLVAWIVAAVRFGLIWRRTRNRTDGTMALIAGWLALGAVSMHGYDVYTLGWWLYHFLLLFSVVTAVTVLAFEYEQLRHFPLTRYYGVLGLTFTAFLALLASALFAQTVENQLVEELSQQAANLSSNLATAITTNLPEMATAEDLQQLMNDEERNQAQWMARRLAGLDIGVVNIYDQNGELLYNSRSTILVPNPITDDALRNALSGRSETRLRLETEPLFYGSDATAFLQTYAPLSGENSTGSVALGALVTLQAIPGLTQAVTEARLAGLLIAGFTMGILFLALLTIVRRADVNITARSRELAQTNAELRAAEAMRDDLTDMIVHDLRSPLTAISLNIDLLQQTMNDPEKADYREQFIGNARGSVQRMLKLINDLLDVARLEAGRLKLSEEPLDVPGLLHDRAHTFAMQAEKDEKSISVSVAEHLPQPPADSGLVERVMDNLIGNALKYTAVGGRIQLRAEPNGTAVLIQVSDDGEGMPPEQAAHIFDKFYQVTGEDGKAKRQGTGLGLPFCKLVVEAHDGRIWVESNPGSGSTFSFTLPLNKEVGSSP